jgi:hypothetical protein
MLPSNPPSNTDTAPSSPPLPDRLQALDVTDKHVDYDDRENDDEFSISFGDSTVSQLSICDSREPVAQQVALTSTTDSSPAFSPVHAPSSPSLVASSPPPANTLKSPAQSPTKKTSLNRPEELRQPSPTPTPTKEATPKQASTPSASTLKTPNIYINGLPPHFPEDELFALCAPFGGVKSVRSFTRHVGERSS